MTKAVKTGGIIFGILFVLIGLWVTHNFVYPFVSVQPNYADVEEAFAKLQFPSDWKEISNSENRGLHGRGCDPLNSSGCFHKGKTFLVPETLTSEQVQDIMGQSIPCSSFSEDNSNPIGGVSYSSLKCSINADMTIGIDLIYKTGSREVSVNVGTN